MTSLRALMAADAADGGTFFPRDSDNNPDGFNELVTFYPRGAEENKSTVNVTVVQDNEEGTREVRGDGVTLNTREGRSTRMSIVIECAADLDVADSQNQHCPDLFKVGGELYAVKRILGRDAYMMSVLCSRRKEHTIRNMNRVG